MSAYDMRIRYWRSGVCSSDLGILVAVAAVNAVRFDAFGEFLADRARSRILGVGRAHDVAVRLHRVLAFEHLDDDRAADHEIDEFAEEGAFLVDRVEAFGRSEEHTSELQSLMRIPYAVFCLKKTNRSVPENIYDT